MRTQHLHEQVDWEPLVGILGLGFVAAVLVALVVWALIRRDA